MQAYNGDDYNGARIVSRAYELRDSVCPSIFQSLMSFANRSVCNSYTSCLLFSFLRSNMYFFQVQGMLSQMDPSLITFSDKIAAQGGPIRVMDDGEGLSFSAAPVVQLATATRTSARLRNVQPEVNLCQSYEALKRTKKNVDAEQTGISFVNWCSSSC